MVKLLRCVQETERSTNYGRRPRCKRNLTFPRSVRVAPFTPPSPTSVQGRRGSRQREKGSSREARL